MIPGARKWLQKLSDEGFRIRIITHRLFIEHFHAPAIQQTIEWLDSNGIPYWDPKTEWLHCADDAIDALVTARDHAASKGLPVQFTGEDLRMVATTIYIDRGKDRRCPPNGGLR